MYRVEWSPVSNRGAWAETLQLAGSDDLPGPTITEIEFAISHKDGCSPIMTKKLSEGDISYDSSTALMTWTFAESVMRQFGPGTYKMGVTLTMNGVEEQYIIGSLPIYDGGVA